MQTGNMYYDQTGEEQPNRYAHLLNSNDKSKSQRAANQQQQARSGNGTGNGVQAARQSHSPQQNSTGNKRRPPPIAVQQQQHYPLGGHNKLEGNLKQQQQQRDANSKGYNQYYSSFSSVDWREQWLQMKERLLEKVEEPSNQRKLILVIVCCALLLDNMLYMVIVPIIPDYLRSIEAWSTYAKDANWVMRRNGTRGAMQWERVGGVVVYEGEDSAVGFLFASKAIVQLFVNPFSGHIIDRIGYEIPMMIGLTVMFFSTMVFACGQTYSVLFLARSLQGVGSAFADTSGLAMIADRFTEENERQRALGIALAFISFGCLVAPPFGSVLYQAAGKEVPFILLSLVCLLDGSLLLLVTPPGTFAQLLPRFATQSPRYPGDQPPPQYYQQSRQQQQQQQVESPTSSLNPEPESPLNATDEANGAQTRSAPKIKRQKSISRRHSMTLASAGEAPKGTPIYVLFQDPCIGCCAGALVVANVSLAFLEPTISIWMENTMPEIEEWQLGMIWLPAFLPHVFGVYLTVKLADKHPKYQWLITAIGLVLEGLSCLMVPFCTSFWALIIPISIICFGIALIDTAILPTLGYLVDRRYVSVYGSIYAIADISYSLSYAVGPVIAGGIVEAIGFTALNFLIAIVTVGYAPLLIMLRHIRDYEPFERQQEAGVDQPFGKFGREPLSANDDEDEEAEAEVALRLEQAALASPKDQQLRSVLTKKGTVSLKMENRRQHSVKIVGVKGAGEAQSGPANQDQQQAD